MKNKGISIWTAVKVYVINMQIRRSTRSKMAATAFAAGMALAPLLRAQQSVVPNYPDGVKSKDEIVAEQAMVDSDTRRKAIADISNALNGEGDQKISTDRLVGLASRIQKHPRASTDMVNDFWEIEAYTLAAGGVLGALVTGTILDMRRKKAN